MIDEPAANTAVPRSLRSYVSDHALMMLRRRPPTGWVDFDGTLAFFDISGFTKLTERLAGLGRAGAEHINDVLNTVFTGLIDEVFRYGGDVLEFGGDAMVVLFDGTDHERRAAVATARMFDFLDGDTVRTPVGDVRLGMSCGLASGSQPYYLVGATRKAALVAGPVSTTMARLEAAANAGEALVDERLADALPHGWTNVRRSDGSRRLRLDRVRSEADAERSQGKRSVAPASDRDVASLLPTQFHGILDGNHRDGELKQVAMAFIRLDTTDDLLASEGVDGLARLLTDLTQIIDLAAAELDVCWLETQAEANSVRWTLISGAPTATERDGERLLRVLCRVAEQTPLPLRIGANLGVVFVGDMGHPARCTYIVMGDTTNLAARLMAKAAPGEIIAGERLVGSCPGRFELTSLEPFTVKGKRAPVNASVVSGVAVVAASGDHRYDESAVPMLGRDTELARLRAAIAAGGVVDLVGEAGVGKTRLWHEARAVELERRWVVTRAEPHEIRSPYLPFRRLVFAAAGIDPRADAGAAATSIADFVDRLTPWLRVWLPLIAEVVGVAVPTTPEVDALDPAFRSERMHQAMAELVVAVAGVGGVLVIEDVHWLDEASRAILEVVARTLAGGETLVVTRRPDGWSPAGATTIELTAIDASFADELLLHEIPATLASDATLARLRESAAGNPLYLIELARSVASSSASSGDVYPETVERLLAARIDRLSVAGRELIRDAAVLGSTMSRELAGRVLDRGDLLDANTWERELGDLVVHDGESVRFSHDLVRVAAYEGLSVRRRRMVHERAGDVIEAWGTSAPVDDRIAALAFHATGSGRPERIIRWNIEAAEEAIDRGAMEIAETLLREVAGAYGQTGADPATVRAVHRRVGFAAERAGHPEAAIEALARAALLSDDRERAEIAVDQARLLEKLGRYRAALMTTARALKTCSDPDVEGHLRLARATIRNFQGRWRDCLEQCHQLLDDFGDGHDPRLLAQAHLLAEWCCTRLNSKERADHERAALQLLTELGDSMGLANLYLNLGESAWRECRVAESVTDFRLSADYYGRAGDVLGAALADNNLAEVLTLQHRLDEAEMLLARANRVSHASNYPHGVLTTVSGLSRIRAWRGDISEALHLQSEALRGFRDLDADDYALDSMVRMVEIHVLGEDATAALAAADEAAAALARLGDVPVIPATLARLRARALLLADRRDEARASFDRALDIATQDGFVYESALAAMGIARMNDDEEALTAATAQLHDLGVIAAPPGS
jgi:class 3 adenylate cyclase/tetratricopeptide (TPR) repeat protein